MFDPPERVRWAQIPYAVNGARSTTAGTARRAVFDCC